MSDTPAERAFARIYESSRGERPEPAREQAWQAFAERGLPTTHDEDWRFTSLAPLETLDFCAPQPAEIPAQALAAARARVGPARLVALANGRVERSDSGIGRLDGKSLASVLDPKRAPFAALNAALARDGAVVEIAAGAADSQPTHVVHFLSDGAPQIVSPRLHVVVRAGATATLIEHFVGAGETRGLSNASTELVLERGARLRYVQLQELPASALHVSSLATHQAAGSHLALCSIALGARLARVQSQSTLEGEQAELELDGLYLGRGTQHQDHHTTIDHAAPRTTSRELFKGILDGRAHGVFHGRIHVRPHSQKIDASQTNRALLLSDGAVIDSKPQLEIYADDVKCSHGASVGQLDPDQIFYLRSRGLELARARALLTFAFGSEVLAKLPSPRLRESLERELLGWLGSEP